MLYWKRGYTNNIAGYLFEISISFQISKIYRGLLSAGQMIRVIHSIYENVPGKTYSRSTELKYIYPPIRKN